VRLEYEGQSPAILKTGDSFFVDAGKVHEGVNIGDVPVKVLATLVVKTGSLLTTPVK
jgi:quercetin dioxygenase-like cupin family protein